MAQVNPKNDELSELLDVKLVQVPLINETYPEKPWLDIPTAAVFKDFSDNNLDELLKLMDQYHALQKDDKKQLVSRQDLLGKIQKLASEKMDSVKDEKLHSALENLSCAAKGKKTYLNKLEHIELDPNHPFRYLVGGKSTHGNLKTMTPIYLSNATGSEYAAIQFDPCSRSDYQGTSMTDHFKELFYEWKKTTELSKETSSFYMWLETKDDSTKKIPPNPMQFIRLCSLNKCSISNDGNIMLANGEIVKEFNGEYTISPNGELYIALGRSVFSKNNLIIYHPNVISPDIPVLCGGMLKIKDGKITSLDNNTGHFQTTQTHVTNAVKLLSNKGCIDENTQFKITYLGPLKANNSRDVKEKTMHFKDFQTEDNLSVKKIAQHWHEKAKLNKDKNTPTTEDQELKYSLDHNIESKAVSKTIRPGKESGLSFQDLMEKVWNDDKEVRHLDLSSCPGFAGGHTDDLAKALTKNKTVETLDLRDNGAIPNSSFKKLIEVIKQHPTIKTVLISNKESRNLTQETMDELNAILKEKNANDNPKDDLKKEKPKID